MTSSIRIALVACFASMLGGCDAGGSSPPGGYDEADAGAPTSDGSPVMVSPIDAASCGACASCSLPWGGSLADGASVTAYAANSVPRGGTCTAEIRTCNHGALSGSYTNDTCTVLALPSAGTCPELEGLRNTALDASLTLQACLDRTPEAVALELEPGRYSLSHRLRLDRAITLRTKGRAGTTACTADASHGCAELFALPEFGDQMGMLLATAAVTVDHIVLNGNRKGRGGTFSYSQCATVADNTMGFNGTFDCAFCTFQHSASMYALCGTGLLVTGPASGVTITGNTFAYNGVHTTQAMWSDGLTVHDAADSTFLGNSFIDNSDIDLIFGGCQRCAIRNNVVTHSADPAAGSFAAIMIQKWPATSGSYENVDVSENSVDCGPTRNCGSGLYIGSESWYPETPYGTLVDGATSGLITKNSVVNAMNALYIAARGLAIYGNNFLNAGGVPIPNSCHANITSETSIVVSPTAASCHFNYENIDPVMSVHYSSASWAGCVPNYPF